MATGDAAAADGMLTVSATAKAGLGYDEINRTRDYIAARHIELRPIAYGGTAGSTPAEARGNLGIPEPTASNVPDSLVMRNGAGQASIATPTSGTHISTKGYVDSRVDSERTYVDNRLSASPASVQPIYTVHGRANPVTTGYVAAYINNDGRLGVTPSARRFKTEIEDWQPDVGALDRIRLVCFKYREALQNIGTAAPLQHGLIAEELLDAGLDWLVVFDDIGRPFTVAYERISLLLIAGYQAQALAIDDLIERVRALEGRRRG